jgi:hydrogenase maturation protein HypF
MSSYHIHIEGLVQGVGFRPFVWRIANLYGVTGFVSNGRDGVHIEVSGSNEHCRDFYKDVVRYAPRGARITGHAMIEIPPAAWEGFVIRESTTGGKPDLLVTPDLALCLSCKAEMLDPADRRFHYPFITCTHCGPRYSILRDVPFDRAHTSMNEFGMCEECQQEYAAPDDKRFYSQTNSCIHCGIRLSLKGPDGYNISNETGAIISFASDLLKRGKIIAMKNLGGYLLLCDATDRKVVQRLRERKQRPAKPFAVLYQDLEMLQVDATVSSFETEALLGGEAPVVIVHAKEHTLIAKEAVAPGYASIGAMLPYTPLMVLLMEHVQMPLVATSGNMNGLPIFFQDDTVIQELAGIADYFIIHNREVVMPQDDSVVRYAGKQRIMLRRARGFAPTYLSSSICLPQQPAIAMGSDLKSTLAFSTGKNLYVSQYLGDLEHYDVQQRYEQTLRHLSGLFDIAPSVVLADHHPSFFSSRLGEVLAGELNIPLKKVPHHEAHFCAVMAENNLLETTWTVLGVIWDGTGWGADGNIWGGEFFAFNDGNIQRVGHLDYFDHILGDKFSREPRLCALALSKDIPGAMVQLRSKFTELEWSLYNKILSTSNQLKTSSMGRLFDGVASLLGLCDTSTHEGEAAQYLEQLAVTSWGGKSLLSQRVQQRGFCVEVLIEEITTALEAGMCKEDLAWEFHLVLVQWIASVAHQLQIKKLAFSGGVFQNALLVRLIHDELPEDYQLFFHRELSPNDECLSVGQQAWYTLEQRNQVTKQRSSLSHLTLT